MSINTSGYQVVTELSPTSVFDILQAALPVALKSSLDMDASFAASPVELTFPMSAAQFGIVPAQISRTAPPTDAPVARLFNCTLHATLIPTPSTTSSGLVPAVLNAGTFAIRVQLIPSPASYGALPSADEFGLPPLYWQIGAVTNYSRPEWIGSSENNRNGLQIVYAFTIIVFPKIVVIGSVANVTLAAVVDQTMGSARFEPFIPLDQPPLSGITDPRYVAFRTSITPAISPSTILTAEITIRSSLLLGLKSTAASVSLLAVATGLNTPVTFSFSASLPVSPAFATLPLAPCAPGGLFMSPPVMPGALTSLQVTFVSDTVSRRPRSAVVFGANATLNSSCPAPGTISGVSLIPSTFIDAALVELRSPPVGTPGYIATNPLARMAAVTFGNSVLNDVIDNLLFLSFGIPVGSLTARSAFTGDTLRSARNSSSLQSVVIPITTSPAFGNAGFPEAIVSSALVIVAGAPVAAPFVARSPATGAITARFNNVEVVIVPGAVSSGRDDRLAVDGDRILGRGQTISFAGYIAISASMSIDPLPLNTARLFVPTRQIIVDFGWTGGPLSGGPLSVPLLVPLTVPDPYLDVLISWLAGNGWLWLDLDYFLEIHFISGGPGANPFMNNAVFATVGLTTGGYVAFLWAALWGLFSVPEFVSSIQDTAASLGYSNAEGVDSTIGWLVGLGLGAFYEAIADIGLQIQTGGNDISSALERWPDEIATARSLTERFVHDPAPEGAGLLGGAGHLRGPIRCAVELRTQPYPIHGTLPHLPAISPVNAAPACVRESSLSLEYHG